MRTGWLWLRCPYFNLYILAPPALESSWLPMQYAEDRQFLVFHRLANVADRGIAGIRVARPVGDEQPVELESVEIVIPRHTDYFTSRFRGNG